LKQTLFFWWYFPTIYRCRELLKNIREVTSYFKRSTKAADRLKKVQKQLELPVLKLVRDCETRWSSTFDMLERFAQQSSAVHLVLRELKNEVKLNCITDYELEEVEGLRELLAPFKQVTTTLSTEKRLTASTVTIFFISFMIFVYFFVIC